MKVHIEHRFDTMQYAIYFYERYTDGTTVLLSPEEDGGFSHKYVEPGQRWNHQPSLLLSEQLYVALTEALHPDQEKLEKLTLKNYEREQGRVDKLMDHVMRLES